MTAPPPPDRRRQPWPAFSFSYRSDIVATPTSTIEEGVEATARLVVDPALEGVTGRYFDGLRETRAHEQAYEPSARARLRRVSDELVGG